MEEKKKKTCAKRYFRRRYLYRNIIIGDKIKPETFLFMITRFSPSSFTFANNNPRNDKSRSDYPSIM